MYKIMHICLWSRCSTGMELSWCSWHSGMRILKCDWLPKQDGELFDASPASGPRWFQKRDDGKWNLRYEDETVASLFFLFIFIKDIGPSKLRTERWSIKGKSINQSIYFISLIKSRSVQIDSIVILTTLVFANSTLLFDSLTSSLKWKKKKEKKKRSRRSFMRKAIIHNNFAWLTLSNLQHKVSSLHPHMQA